MQENTKSVAVKMTARRCFRTEPIWQYDGGHVLTFEGFDLPTAFEVHFSRSPMGKAIPQIGTDGVCTVPEMFTQDAGIIYAWLYIADTDSRLTKYSIEIPVAKRAKPTNQQPTPVEQSAIDQAIAALNVGVERSETAADAAESAQEAAEGYAEAAGNSAITATNAASSAASAKTAAETAARNAATSATDAHTSREAADQSATNAGISERNAAASASAAAGSATSAAASASQASGSATAASGSASTASTKASEAAQSATDAAGSAASASEDAGTASTAATAAEASATAAAGSATAAAGSATSAAQSATAAAGSASDAAEIKDYLDENYGEISDDVNSLKSALNGNDEYTYGAIQKEYLYTNSIDSANMTRVTGYQINNYGDLTEKANWSYLWFIAPASGTYRITGTASQQRFYVYNSSTFNQTTLVKKFVNNEEVSIEQGQYVAITAWSLTFVPTAVYATESEIALKPAVSLTDTMHNEIFDKFSSILGDGYMAFFPDDFELGSYKSYSSKDSRTARARCKSPMIFNREIILVADPGYFIDVCYPNNTHDGPTPVVNVPANTNFAFYIREVTEDLSQTIDVPTFVSKVHISTALAPIELYRPWFSDVTMFPRIGISGDSYSAGGGVISGVRALTWGKNLERESGVTVDIYAQSGIAIQDWTTNTTNGLPALLAGEECGMYWFAHGINGTGSDASIGTPEDMSAEPKPHTFYGQYVYAIETIQRAFPQARIVVATIVGTSYHLNQTTYKNVNTVIRNIAEYCSVPVIDLAEDDFYKSNWYAEHHLSNHPTAMLNAGIAHANRRLFAKCVMENADYFVDYGDKYKYPVSCPPVTGGKITATPSIVDPNATVTLTATAYPGYHFVRYDTEDATISNGSFTMPSKKVTITGVFEADS